MPQPTATPQILTAAWVHPVDVPPIPDGFVAWDDTGRITAVGRQADLPADRWGLPVSDFPDGLILPGLINLHTHLEYAHLPLGHGPLHAWILNLVKVSWQWGDSERLTSALDGARASLAAGVTCVADTSPTGASLQAAAQTGLRGVFYQEAFGLDDGAAGLARVQARLEILSPLTAPQRRLGLSPHSPYTVSLAHWRRLLDYARAANLPLSTHLAESPAEIAWFRGEPSDIPAFLAAMKVGPYTPPPGHPVTVLAEAGLLNDGLLAAHCVHAGPEERRRLKEHGVVAVHCPRSNHHLGVGTAPLADWAAEGLRWGVGTDSPASGGDLNLVAELKQPTAESLGLAPEAWLRQLTLEAARHLGWAEAIGSLTPGKAADLIVVTAPALADWLDAAGATVRQAWVAGVRRDPDTGPAPAPTASA